DDTRPRARPDERGSEGNEGGAGDGDKERCELDRKPNLDGRAGHLVATRELERRSGQSGTSAPPILGTPNRTPLGRSSRPDRTPAGAVDATGASALGRGLRVGERVAAFERAEYPQSVIEGVHGIHLQVVPGVG